MARFEGKNPSVQRDGGRALTAGTKLRQAGWRIIGRVAPTASHLVADIPQLRDRVRLNTDEVQALHAEIRTLRAQVDRLRSLPGELGAVRTQTLPLVDEVGVLRLDVQEARRLHQRVAELTDVVSEVLMRAADTHDARIESALTEFASSTF